MADEAAQPTGASEEAAPAPVLARTPPSWRELWQAPLMVVAVLGLGAGVVKLAMSKPKPDVSAPLAQAQELIAGDRHQDAIAVLNERVFPHVDAGIAELSEQRTYHVLIARAIYLGQQQLGISLEPNNQAIVREYLEAEGLGEALEARDQYYLADALISIGREPEAQGRAERLVESDPAKRRMLYRRMIERALAKGEASRERANTLLNTMLGEATLPPGDRAWATARQAETLLASGYADEVISRLLRAVPRLSGAEDRDVAELHLLLGRAYLEINAQDEAVRSLQRAGALLSAGDPLRGDLLAMEAEADARQGRIAEARDKYLEISESYSGSRTYLRALLGLGESDALLGQYEDALGAYRRLADVMESGERSPLVRPAEVAESLLRHHATLMIGTPARGGEPDPVMALEFAELAQRALGPEHRDASVLSALAASHRAIASELLPNREASADPAADIAMMEPSAREEARRHLRAAGRYAMLLSSEVAEDAAAFADALWMAAEAHDLAGDQDEAVIALLEFIESFPSDQRHAEGRFRLGVAYQARGEYERAAETFRGIISDRGMRDVGIRVGPYADASYVPLAQCLILDAKPENDAEAESLLMSVVEGEIGGTRSRVYADALSELAGVYDRSERWPRAIERYTEAIERYPQDERMSMWRFRLADACRRDAERMRGVLAGALPDADRLELERARRDRLRVAMEMYESVRSRLEAADGRRRRGLESLYLRNSWFYLGDCAFDLGQYDEAVRLYEAAKERYPNDPASLVAMVQIVNAYVEQDDYARARTANDRARRFYESLPESVWDDPNLPMTRRDWERWLEASSRLYAMEQVRVEE